MKCHLLCFGILSLLSAAPRDVSAQNYATQPEQASPELQFRIRTLIATLGPDPSRNTCMPQFGLPFNQAKEELIAIGKPATLPICAVLAEKDIWRRIMATEALIEIRDPRALKPLLRALQFDSSNTVRGEAAEALSNLGDKDVVPFLIAALKIRSKDPKDLYPAYAAGKVAEALGKLGDPRAIPALLSLIGSREGFIGTIPAGHVYPLGQEAAKALGKLGSSAAEPLMQLLHHANRDVRSDAAKALGVMKESRAVPLLLSLLPSSIEGSSYEDNKVNMEVVEAIGEIGDKRATQPLLQKVDVQKLQGHSAESFDIGLIEAIGKIGDSQAVEPLLPLLESKDSYVRQETLVALSRIGTPKIVEPLLNALQQEGDGGLRRDAAKWLGKIGDPIALPALRKALEDEDVGDTAAVAIGRIDNSILLSLLEDKNDQVRRAVVSGLGEANCKDAVPQLLTLIRDETVGHRALEAIGKLGTPDLLPLIEPLMREPHNPNPWAARRAVIAIKRRYKL